MGHGRHGFPAAFPARRNVGSVSGRVHLETAAKSQTLRRRREGTVGRKSGRLGRRERVFVTVATVAASNPGARCAKWGREAVACFFFLDLLLLPLWICCARFAVSLPSESPEHVCCVAPVAMASAASSSGVKKRRTLSLEIKECVIRDIESGLKKASVAAKHGVSDTTVSTIYKNKDKLRQQLQQDSSSLSRNKIRTSKYEDVDAALFRWFREVRARSIPVSDPMLQQKAKCLGAFLGHVDFNPLNGRIQRFKDRHGISCKVVCEESGAVDDESIEVWLRLNLESMLSTYTDRDIYNADEAGLFYNLLPNRTLALKAGACSSRKVSKERITVLFCANLDGSDKCRLFVIGKSARPHCFKKRECLPVTYKANKNAWMTQDLLTSWLCKFDEDMVAEKWRVVLTLDNCTAHNVKPKLTTSQTKVFACQHYSKSQPLDQGVIATVKADIISKCFKRAGFVRNAKAPEDNEQSDMSLVDENLNTDDVWSCLVDSNFVTATDTFQELSDAGESELSVCEEASTDDAIVAAVRGSAEVATDDESDGEDDVDPTPEPDFACKDALEYLAKADIISKCFKRAGFVRNAEALEDDEQSDTSLADETLNTDDVWSCLVDRNFVTATDTFQEFVNAGESELSVCEEASTDDAIVAAVRGSAEVATDDESDGEDDVDPTPEPDFACKDALEYLAKVKTYCAKNSLSEKSLMRFFR
ncbi:hypothetical protein HPB51_002842 [Rhipicephalus microplus]|uniref:Tick transposon n=1 Tax=Rhipicephalus microplus TaxID=6941 RepID=A0A9J6EWF9_RHIMP|nr:hypothetical protein HPB51_002842 [Rhipicephalus microplus]